MRSPAPLEAERGRRRGTILETGELANPPAAEPWSKWATRPALEKAPLPALAGLPGAGLTGRESSFEKLSLKLQKTIFWLEFGDQKGE